MAVASRPLLNEAQRSHHLDRTIAEWSHNGWQIVARTPTTAQLKKPRGSLIPSLLLVLVACIVAAIPLYALVTTEQLVFGVSAVFILGTLFVVAGWASARQKLVYLTMVADGELRED